jgi:dihydroneopterin aldolase
VSDSIFLNGMVFYGYHGATSQEKELGQSFIVDVELDTDLTKPGESDDLKDTVDYSKVYRVVKEILEGPGRNLLENVAEGLARKLLGTFPLDGVTVRVTKPHVPIKGAVLAGAAVEIHRRRGV